MQASTSSHLLLQRTWPPQLITAPPYIFHWMCTVSVQPNSLYHFFPSHKVSGDIFVKDGAVVMSVIETEIKACRFCGSRPHWSPSLWISCQYFHCSPTFAKSSIWLWDFNQKASANIWKRLHRLCPMITSSLEKTKYKIYNIVGYVKIISQFLALTS